MQATTREASQINCRMPAIHFVEAYPVSVLRGTQEQRLKLSDFPQTRLGYGDAVTGPYRASLSWLKEVLLTLLTTCAQTSFVRDLAP